MLGIIGKIKNLITSTPPFGMPDQGWMRGYRNPQNCHKQMHQHAKFILAKGQLLIGSHNFDENGVGLGTQELALRTNHPAILGLIQEYYHIFVLASPWDSDNLFPEAV